MRQKHPLTLPIAIASALACFSPIAFGLDKANNTDNLSSASSWVGGTTIPGAFDIARWNNTVGANNVSMGTNLTWGSLQITNPDGTVTINGAQTLTLNTSLGQAYAIDISASKSLVMNANLAFSHGSAHSIRVGTGGSLAINGTFTRNTGTIINFQNAGTLTTSTITNTNGIIGAWATFGTGAATRFATVNASNIIAYTGGTAAPTAAAVTDTTGTVNYDLADGGALGAGASFNTLRYTGAAAAITGAFSANGIMNAGTGALTFSDAVTIGNSRDLVLHAITGDITLNGNITNNSAGASTFTKTGAGTVYTTGVHAYTGTLSISGGVLDVGNVSNLGSGAVYLGNNGILQGNGTLTKAINNSGNSNINAGQIGGHSGGFAARGGDLIINFGGSAAQFSMNTSGQTFGNDLRFGSATSTHRVIVMNDISINSGGTRTITVTSGTGTDSAEIRGVLSNGTTTGLNNSGILKSGNGILILSGVNNYSNVTRIAGGILSISNIKDGGVNSNIGNSSSDASNLNFSGTSTLRYTGTTATTNRGFSINNGVTASIEVTNAATKLTFSGDISTSTGSFTKSGAGTLILTGAKNYSGRTNVLGGVLDVGDVTFLTGDGGIVINNAILQGYGTITHAFNLSSGGNPGINQINGLNGGFSARGGELILNFTNGLAFNTALEAFGDNLIFGTADSNNRVVVQSTINLNSNGGSRLVTVNSGAGGDYVLFQGAITQPTGQTSGLTKQGAGLMVVSGENTYGGPTLINAGSFFANYTGVNALASSTGSSNVTVASIGTLGGYGKIGTGASLVTVNGRLNPGDTTLSDTRDTLTINGSLTLGSAAITNLEIATLADFDKVVVSAHAILDGTINLDFTGFNSALFANSFTLDVFDWDTVNVTGFTVGNGTTGDLKLVGVDYGGHTGSWDFSQFTTSGLGGGSITWNATSIPEPSRALLLMFAIGALTLRRRKAQGQC